MAKERRNVGRRRRSKAAALDSALIRPAGNDDAHLVKLLLDAGANPRAHHDEALRRAAAYAPVEIVKLLLKNGADPRDFDDEPLRLAARMGRTWTVRVLLRAGAFMREAAALRQALRHGHEETARVLQDWVQPGGGVDDAPSLANTKSPDIGSMTRITQKRGMDDPSRPKGFGFSERASCSR